MTMEITSPKDEGTKCLDIETDVYKAYNKVIKLAMEYHDCGDKFIYECVMEQADKLLQVRNYFRQGIYEDLDKDEEEIKE